MFLFLRKLELTGWCPLGNTNAQSKVTLVFFLGGCTFTEISAIRFLESQSEGRDYLIATTKLINGNSLLESAMENIDGKLP